LIASASLFCLNASSGYLSLAAANAGARKGRYEPDQRDEPRTLQDQAPRESVFLGCHPKSLQRAKAVTGFAGNPRPRDFPFGQNSVSSERRHHGQRIALGFVGHDRDDLVAVGIFLLDVDQFRPQRAGILAALDRMAGQAIALAAIEGELFPFVDG